ncbi:hypothetical protein HELRODRAFT_125656, partial [Helobdella robusta]|uniref:C2H2-type domain-containing protein n=1 Tax=Helobdella robusta TaxID=6412 RepID=T1EH70_HELRO
RNHLATHLDCELTQKQYSCSHCKMKFKHRQNLLRHEVVHTGAKPFVCKQCNKTFPTATNQKRHERIHKGQKLTYAYACTVCRKCFQNYSNMCRHRRLAHWREKKFLCLVCYRDFHDKDSLLEHQDT